jgi:hypothetical protein
MADKDALERAKQMRAISYTIFLDAIKGLKDATRLIDERIQKDGPSANFSIDSDLLTWSQAVWKASNKLYALDQIIEELRITNQEVKDDSAAARDDSPGG